MIKNLRQFVNKYPLFIWAIPIFLVIFYFNAMTPLNADDFTYSVFQGAKIDSIGDIVRSQYAHYFRWGGRTVVHFIAQLFLLAGKSVFNIANSLMYLFFVFIVYYMINGFKKRNVPLFLLINLAFWIFNPVFGETIFWLTGSCNYLWGTSISLTFLLPFRLYYDKQFTYSNKIFIPYMMFFGLLGGWCNENGSGAVFLFALSLTVYFLLNKIKVPLWCYVGLLFNLIGFALMVLAPGNSVRSLLLQEEPAFFLKMSNRFIHCTDILKENYLYLLIISFMLFTLLIVFKVDKKKIIFAGISFCSAILCNYAMVLSPTYPQRASFGVLTMLIISIGICISFIEARWFSTVVKLSLSTALVFFALSLPLALYDVHLIKTNFDGRIEYIKTQKSEGNKNLTVTIIKKRTKYNGIINDITDDKDHWINKDCALYYGLESITGDYYGY